MQEVSMFVCYFGVVALAMTLWTEAVDAWFKD